MNDTQPKQSTRDTSKIWLFMLIAPISALVLVLLLQAVVSFGFPGSHAVGITILKVIIVAIGSFASMGIFLTPLWLILYLHTRKEQKQ